MNREPEIANNVHNRFYLVMEKNNPDVYSCINYFLKEQGDTKIAIIELQGEFQKFLDFFRKTATNNYFCKIYLLASK